MVRLSSIRLLTPLLMLGCSFAPAPETDDAVRMALDAVLDEHAEFFRTGNIEGLVSQYAPDAVIRAAGMSPLSGHDAIRAVLPQWINAAPIKSLEYENVDLAVRGDTAFQIVSFVVVAQPVGAGEMKDGGSCAIWWVRNEARSWKVSRSLCNSSTPPQQQVSRSTAPATRD